VVLEVFSGVGRIYEAFRRHGVRASKFDICDDPDLMDVLQIGGWFNVLKKTLRLREGALLWLGHPCSMCLDLQQFAWAICRPPMGQLRQAQLPCSHMRASFCLLMC
jgi:hypothetical protein